MPDHFCNFRFSRAPLLLITFSIFVTFLFAVDLPLDFHGRGMVSKYLNAPSARYNMDAIVELYCTVIKLDKFSFYLNYRDDLDMAVQSGGVSFDPRFAHYYMAGGFDYSLKSYFARFYFVHDCVHDIDSLVPGTPVFNRFRLQFGDGDFHYSRWPEPAHRFIWSLSLGVYPHFPYHGWDINAGADYNFETIMEVNINLYKNRFFAADLNPKFHFIMGDTCLYQQHLARLLFYYHHNGKRFGVGLDYNLKNNDPIKNPDKLWLLSTYIEF